MAKKQKAEGIKLPGSVFTCRSIAFDANGIPWLIDPAEGTVGLVSLNTEGVGGKQSAVKKRK